MNKNICNKICIAIIALFIGVAFGILYERNILLKNLYSIAPIREAGQQYKFIHPLLAYNTPTAAEQNKLGSLKNKIEGLIYDKKNSNEFSGVSIYFHDLNKSRWAGINEDASYNPASLLKVAVLISYYKKTEEDLNLLNKRFIYTQDLDKSTLALSQGTPSVLQINKNYSVSELIDKMIIDSDNGARSLLLANLDQKSFASVFNSLGMQDPSLINFENKFVISPKTYSLFFRVLYNATYLNREMSEKALELLSRVKFKDGLTAGIPNEIAVAHKFGEYATVNNGIISEQELHDCGIIYYEPSPYFLCIMTKGQDKEKLKSAIKEISQIIYQDFTKSN